MSAVLGPLPLDQLPKSKPVTPMLSCLVSPGTTVLLGPAFTSCSRYRLNTRRPTPIPVATPDNRMPRGGQRAGAERRKLAASGAADARGDAVNSTAAKAMPPR